MIEHRRALLSAGGLNGRSGLHGRQLGGETRPCCPLSPSRPFLAGLCASRALFTLLCALSFLTPARAVDFPAPRLETVFPPGGQAGSQVDVSVTGTDLEEAGALHFSHTGLTAEPKGKGFTVKIAADVAPGIYDIRVSSPLGVSNPRAFAVGQLPELLKKGANSPETAMELPIDSTVSGSVVTGTMDYYKFTAKSGQRLMIECATTELDSKLNAVMAILDPTGRELETSFRGGFLDFTAPADGVFLVRLNDLTYAGTAMHNYRLTLTSGPHLDFVFPPSAAPGAKGKFMVYGRNLPSGTPAGIKAGDGRPLEKLETEIEAPAAPDVTRDGLLAPAAAAIEGFSYRLKGPKNASNAVFIGLTKDPIIAEHEPNNTVTETQKITVPCDIAGQFFPAGDVDGYTFDAKKGDIWWIEVISHRLGLTTAPFLLVQRDDKDVKEVYAVDPTPTEKRFSTASNDPSFRLEVKEDGAYRVTVRDLYGTARLDPRNVYRLSIHRESTAFSLAALSEAPPETANDRSAYPRAAMVRGGGTTAIRVVAFREDATGEIELSAEGLPAGVACGPSKIPAGQKGGVLLLTAAAEKPERWVGAIRVIGKLKTGDQVASEEARGGTVRWDVKDFQTDPVQARLSRDFAIAVNGETAPLSIEPAEEKVWEATVGGKLEIPLKITRRGEFKDVLKLKPAGAPGLEAAKEVDVAANAATTSGAIDLTATKIPAGAYTIWFQALTKGKYKGKDVTTTIYSTPIQIVIKAPEPKAPEPKK